MAATSIYDFTMKDIDGKDVPLKSFEGDVLLVVNVASKCGLTPHYEGLEALYEDKKGQDFAVLGFPANEFGAQEPGTDSEIKQFCTLNYGVKFPMFSKIVVKGGGIHPLYQWLTAQLPDQEPKGEIAWNFEKFLVGRDGKVIQRFPPPTKPDDPALVGAIDKALGEK